MPDLPYMPILIVDDLCDGGGTFLGIANQAEGTVPLGLYITHGIFSKGFGELGKHFSKIYTTNSYYERDENTPSPLVTVYDCLPELLK